MRSLDFVRFALVFFVASLAVLVDARDAFAADGPSLPASGEIRFEGKNLFGPAPGTFHRWRVTKAALDPARLADAVVEVEIDLTSVDTGNEDRDTHLRTADFFDVEQYPSATVRVHSIEEVSGGEQQTDYGAVFEISMHGETHAVPGRFSMEGGGPFRVTGELVLDRTIWGIGAPKRWFNPMSIDHEIPVEFDVEFSPVD